MEKKDGHTLFGRFFRDYGMIFVLLLLCVLFSLLTLAEQHPTGVKAGRQVADQIVNQEGSGAGVVIVTRDTAEDHAFADAICAADDCARLLCTAGIEANAGAAQPQRRA